MKGSAMRTRLSVYALDLLILVRKAPQYGTWRQKPKTNHVEDQT